jgi:RNase adaptor protein for sRNA GlmZ degradation
MVEGKPKYHEDSVKDIMNTIHEPNLPPQPSPRHLSITVSLVSYGHSNGPFVPSDEQREKASLLAFNIRHLPNPPRNLRAMTTGLSPRLRKEFLKNEVVQHFLTKTYDEIAASIKESYEALSHEYELEGTETTKGSGVEIGDEYEDASVSIIVTVCCEEGRHRSVAFVEELAQRLSQLRNGDGTAGWRLDVNVAHRDIGGPVPGGSSSEVQHTKAKGRFKGGKDARRINQKTSVFEETNEIV